MVKRPVVIEIRSEEEIRKRHEHRLRSSKKLRRAARELSGAEQERRSHQALQDARRREVDAMVVNDLVRVTGRSRCHFDFLKSGVTDDILRSLAQAVKDESFDGKKLLMELLEDLRVRSDAPGVARLKPFDWDTLIEHRQAVSDGTFRPDEDAIDLPHDEPPGSHDGDEPSEPKIEVKHRRHPIFRQRGTK